jgi:hypothetical protein
MPSPKARPVALTDPEVEHLRRITRRETAPHHLVRRARIVLLMHDGLGNTAVAAKMDIARSTAEDRRKRWIEGCAARRACEAQDLPLLIEAQLGDAPRPGAPVTFSAEEVTQIIALALQPPEAVGHPVTHWTPQGLAREAVRQGIVDSISPRTVGRFLKRGRPQAAPELLLAPPDTR